MMMLGSRERKGLPIVIYIYYLSNKLILKIILILRANPDGIENSGGRRVVILSRRPLRS